jgi:hypothetical protein
VKRDDSEEESELINEVRGEMRERLKRSGERWENVERQERKRGWEGDNKSRKWCGKDFEGKKKLEKEEKNEVMI